MKKLYCFIVLLIFFFGSNSYLFSQFSGGSGTSADPYQVADATDLSNVRNYLTSYFKQTADIDLSGENWNPIAGGGTSDLFTGNYNGQNFKITNLTIDRTTTPNVGLFGHLGEGTETNPVVVRNVKLENVNVAGARGTGSLVGRVTGNIYTLIEGCSATGETGKRSVTGNAATGGLVGSNNSVQETPGGTNNPIISKCWADIDVTYSGADPGSLNAEKFGGLAGCNQKGTILDSYARGSVTVNNSGNSWDALNVGGLAGCILYRGRIERSFSTGAVSGTNVSNLGGLVGNVGTGGNAGVVVDSYWDEGTSGQSSSAGGTGLTTSEMKVQANFVGFDFTNIWNIDGSTNDGYPFLRAVSATTYVEWSGSSSESWDVSGNWVNDDLPGSSDIAIIPSGLSNYPVISTTATNLPKGLSIAEGASITLQPGGELTISEELLTSAGNSGIILNSTSSGTGSLIHNSQDVPGTIYRYVTGNSTLTAKSYHTVSVPLTQAANPVSGLFLGSYLYEFDASGQQWNSLGTPTNTPLSVDKGYLMYYPDANTTYSFAGPMNNGVFDAAEMPTDASKYHLIPNPYPSAIDWDATSGWTKTNLVDAIWIWSSSDGNWAAYGNDAGTNGASQYIPVGQSFFVKSNATGNPALSMTNDVRVHNSQSFLKNAGEANNVLRIKAVTQNYGDEIIVRYHELATDNFDENFDVAKLYGFGDTPQLYSFSDDDFKLSINSLKTTEENKILQLGFEMEVPGEVNLMFSSMDTFDPETSFHLHDLLTGVTIDVRSNPEYTFLSDPDYDPLRFQLEINHSSSASEINQNIFNAYFVGRNLVLNLNEDIHDKSLLQLLNTNGQIVYSSEINHDISSVYIPGITPGIYFAKLINETGSYTIKVSYR